MGNLGAEFFCAYPFAILAPLCAIYSAALQQPLCAIYSAALHLQPPYICKTGRTCVRTLFHLCLRKCRCKKCLWPMGGFLAWCLYSLLVRPMAE